MITNSMGSRRHGEGSWWEERRGRGKGRDSPRARAGVKQRFRRMTVNVGERDVEGKSHKALHIERQKRISHRRL